MVNFIGWSIGFIESSEKGHIEYFIFSKDINVIHSKKRKNYAWENICLVYEHDHVLIRESLSSEPSPIYL